MRVVIMRGAPGSGKSTYAKKLTERLPTGVDFAICSADNYFIGDDGVYRFDMSKIGEAHSYCFSAFLRYLQSGTCLIVVDNTNIRSWEFAGYVQMARYYGAEVEIVRLNVDPMVAHGRNVHSVPVGSVIRMAKSMEPLPKALGSETVVQG